MANQAIHSKSDASDSRRPERPIQVEESALSERLRQAIQSEPVTAFGRRCGIGEATLRKYFKGTLPNIENLIAMADAANVSIEWLAAGRGPKQRGAAPAPPAPAPAAALWSPAMGQPLDEALLSRAIGAVQEGLAAINRTLPPDKHAQLIGAAYHLMAKLEASDKLAANAIAKAREQVVNFITLTA